MTAKQLSAQQQEAVDAFEKWLANPDTPFFRLDGCAGTGKTTIAIVLAGLIRTLVMFAAFTGKAASVMRRKGCTDAGTLHQLLYVPRMKSKTRLNQLETQLASMPEDHADLLKIQKELKEEREKLARPSFDLKEDIEARRAGLIVLDEASMIDGRIGQDLMALKVPVLVLSDPGQLPPVHGTGFFMNGEANFTLTEIHRQAEGNPIIELATKVRMGESLQAGQYGDSLVIDQPDLTPEMAQAADQILCGRNKTVAAANKYLRKLWGRKSLLPEVGDKMLCLANDHNKGVLNGTIWTVFDEPVQPDDDIVVLALRSEDDGTEVVCDCFIPSILDPQTRAPFGVNAFTFGYAMTVHKSQGSQWDNVLILDESGAFRENASKHLYTALTRAAKRVTVVRGYRL